MTIKQMEYVLMTARCSSFNEAARRLYISQPSLSESIKKLEQELNITIFHRERFGVQLTEEGENLLGAIQNILDQVHYVETFYESRGDNPASFAAASIRFYFMSEVYADMSAWFDKNGGDVYDLSLQDEETLEVIDDVAEGRVELGVITYTDHSRAQIMNMLNRNNLEYHDIVSSRMWAYVGAHHPLLQKDTVTMKDLEQYPYISVQQTRTKHFYFTEEGIFFPANKKHIYVRDTADLRSIIQKTDAFVMGTGAIASDISPDEVTMIQIADAPLTTICWLCKNDAKQSIAGEKFIELLQNKLFSLA